MSALREGEVPEIYAAMVALEMAGGNGVPGLADVDSDFQAFDVVPEADPDTVLPFPFAFRFPPRWTIQDRALGSGGDKPFTYTIDIAIPVGYSSNSFGPLTADAIRYIKPFYNLYMANRSIGGTVQNIKFVEGYVGDMIINNIKMFGPVFPVIIEQRLNFVSSL